MMHHYLTFFRLISGPVMFFLIVQNCYKSALFLSFLAIISDVFDGFFSRCLIKDLNFGAFFDAIADKTFVYCSVFGFLLEKNLQLISLPFLIIWIIRDLFIIFHFFQNKSSFVSLMSGKIFTAFQFCMILFMLFFFQFEVYSNLLFVSFWGSFIFAILSAYQYHKFFSKNR